MPKNKPTEDTASRSSDNLAANCPVGCRIAPQTLRQRAKTSRDIRLDRAKAMLNQGVPSQTCNGDEEKYQQNESEFNNRFIA